MTIWARLAALLSIVGVLWGAYTMGYTRAETEGQLALGELKRAHAEAVIAAQTEARIEYETKIKSLSDSLARARSLSDERMRQLEKFRSADRDLETCLDERSRLAGIAVRMESLADRAVSHLEAMTVSHAQDSP